MKHPINEQAITVSVGQFIREVRNGNKKPSMYSILAKNGVKSPERAKNLINRMIENNMIHKHRDGSYSLCKQNFDMAEVMPILLKRSYTRKPKTVMTIVVQEDVNPLDSYLPSDLVNYLRSKGWTVDAYREDIVITRL